MIDMRLNMKLGKKGENWFSKVNYFFSYSIMSCNLKIRYRNIYFYLNLLYIIIYVILLPRTYFFFLLGLEIIINIYNNLINIFLF